MTKKPEEKNMIDLANEAKNTVYNAAGISNTEKLEIIEAEQKGERKIEKLEKIANESKGMGIKGVIATTLGILGFFVGASGIGILMNWGVEALMFHNWEYKSKNSPYYSITKIDGPFSKTELTKYKEKITIERCGSFKKGKVYIDENNDGKIDRLKIYKEDYDGCFFDEDLEQKFDRSKHFEKHAEKFLEADKYFQEQLERFKPHIDAWKEQYKQD